MDNDLKIIGGTSNPALSQAICRHLKRSLSSTLVGAFSDGETRVEVSDNLRGSDVFVIQSTCSPVNNSVMELCIILDALKRASCRRVTAVVPYYGYARQDRKVVPRAPISAKLVADFLTVAGMNRMVTIDLHAGQIQGFFNLPVDNLYAAPVFLNYLRELGDEVVIVSPDAGGGGTGPGIRQTPWGRVGHHRQAPGRAQQSQGHERDRPTWRANWPSCWTT